MIAIIWLVVVTGLVVGVIAAASRRRGQRYQFPVDACCATCEHFEDHRGTPATDGDEPGEPDGYCCAPFHFTKASAHADWGGHWTHSTSRCSLWERAATPNEPPPDAA